MNQIIDLLLCYSTNSIEHASSPRRCLASERKQSSARTTFHSYHSSRWTMIRVALLTVYSLMAVHTAAVSLGILPHGALVNTNSNTTMNASDCRACVCAMFASSNILALNCFLNYSNGVVCQLFNNATYLQSNSTEIEINLNSTLYFRQLPIRNQFNKTVVASDAGTRLELL